MRTHRRHLLALAAAALALAVLLVWDPLGSVADWIAVAEPATGDPAEIAAALRARRERIDALSAALAADPLLSAALLGAGLGAGLILGSAGAYLRERRRIRRGEYDAH